MQRRAIFIAIHFSAWRNQALNLKFLRFLQNESRASSLFARNEPTIGSLLRVANASWLPAERFYRHAQPHPSSAYRATTAFRVRSRSRQWSGRVIIFRDNFSSRLIG